MQTHALHESSSLVPRLPSFFGGLGTRAVYHRIIEHDCGRLYMCACLCPPQVDLISSTKANILKNEGKIQQMLNSLAFSST